MFLGLGASGNLWYGGRAIAGGSYTSPKDTIQYWTISTTGNASDFGNLSFGRNELAGCSNGSRGLFLGGFIPTSPSATNSIEYITISSTGNSTDFGDLNFTTYYPGGVGSKADRGAAAGGILPTSPQTSSNAIDYVTMSTTGNATDFGDLTNSPYAPGAASNGTRGVWSCGGAPPSYTSNIIQYVTLANTGNATDFGDATITTYNHMGAASDESNDRGVFAGASADPKDVIDYIAISSAGNATDFGDLTVGRRGVAASSNGSRATFGGGHPNTGSSTIDYITIMSTGNATDFGDMFQDGWSAAGLSGD